MNGMDRLTGKPLSDRAHLAQSVGDILTTPIGTRPMRRDYGSAVFELIDQAGNALGRSRLYAAVAVALARWEPRMKLTKVGVSADSAGRAVIDLEGKYLEDATPNSLFRLSIPLNPA